MARYADICAIRTLPPGQGRAREHVRRFRPGQIIRDDTSLSELIEVLTRQEYAFVAVFGMVGGYVNRGHLNSPVTRMWLFGIITLFEMRLVRLIEKYFPNESWRSVVPAARLEKAIVLQQERSRPPSTKHSRRLPSTLGQRDRSYCSIP